MPRPAVRASLQVECLVSTSMAGSRFAYVRDFELSDVVVPHTYMLVRIDGTGFHR